jgi:hypothetical protein
LTPDRATLQTDETQFAEGSNSTAELCGIPILLV